MTIAAAAVLTLSSCGGAQTASLPSATGTEVPAPVALDEGPGLGDRPSPGTAAAGVMSRPDPAGSTPASGSGPATAPSGRAATEDGAGAVDPGVAAPAVDDRPSTGERPTSAEIASLVDRELTILGDDAQHAVVDVDDDDIPEVILAGVLDDTVTVALWHWIPGTGYDQPAIGRAGPGRAVTDLRVADLTGDGDLDLLLGIGGGGRESMASWSLATPGELVPHVAEGGCFDGSNVLGATGARLQQRPDGPPAVLAVCDDSPLPIKDWSTVTYEFVDGAYRASDEAPAVLSPPPVATEPDDPGSGGGGPGTDDPAAGGTAVDDDGSDAADGDAAADGDRLDDDDRGVDS